MGTEQILSAKSKRYCPLFSSIGVKRSQSLVPNQDGILWSRHDIASESPVPETKPGFPFVTVTIVLVNLLVFVGLLQQGQNVALMESYSTVPREIITGYNLIGTSDGEIREERTLTGNKLDKERDSIIRTGAQEATTFFPGLRRSPPFVTLFTALFLHINWEHLLMNMGFLLAFGPPLERFLGRIKYLAFYIGVGVFAGFTTVLFIWATFGLRSDQALTHSLGASGAIAGVMGCFPVLHPKGEMRIPHEWPLIISFEKVPTWMGYIFAGVWGLIEYYIYKAKSLTYSASQAGYCGRCAVPFPRPLLLLGGR